MGTDRHSHGRGTARSRPRAPLTCALGVCLLTLAGCGGGKGNAGSEPPAPPPPGLSEAPVVSTRGSLTLEQFDRDGQPSAPVSRSSRFTLIPDGASQ